MKDLLKDMSDLERVNVILEYFRKPIREYYKDDTTNYADLVEKYTREFHHTGVSKKTAYNWMHHHNSPQDVAKNMLCSVFNLAPWIWKDKFDNGMPEMTKRMPEYIDVQLEENLDEFVYLNEEIDALSIDERSLINSFDGLNQIDLNAIDLNTYSPSFLHELALKLKSKKQINEALAIIEKIFDLDSNYKYAHGNELKLLRAVCYSHDLLRDWNKAIEILRELFGNGYHHKNLEVATLLASNYKRMALTNENGNWCEIDEINTNYLNYALNLYQKTMKMRKTSEKYYDAINVFYLLKILVKLDNDYTEESIKEAVKELNSIYHETKFKLESWWETATKAEFLMLNGDVENAKREFTEHMDLDKNEAFNIDTTIRQLEMYIHFTDDENAVDVLQFLENAKKDIEFI